MTSPSSSSSPSSPSSRPRLRAVETIVVPDARYGKLLVLRDTQGITDAQAAIPPPLVPIVARFDGTLTCEEIAKAAAAEMGVEVPIEVVVRLAQQLDDALFLDSPASRGAKARIEKAFADARVRPASHAGGAYHKDPELLAKYLDEQCLGSKRAGANGSASANGSARRMVALIAPHIDPWRGAVGYGHAYNALAATLPAEVDTFILFGTSHAPMREPFALCKKAFDTPFGAVLPDDDAIDAIARDATFDAYADQFNHKQEHSLEFQVVFLKHLLKERPVKIIPVLAGLGAHQANGTDPSKDDHANRFLDAVGELVAKRAGRVLLVAGADLAHVGPRFGDETPLRERERRTLEVTDKSSLAHAAGGDSAAFWAHVAGDLATRRVCGLGPIYSLLRTLPARSTGEVLHYEQTIDDEDGSIVSHAAVGFFG